MSKNRRKLVIANIQGSLIALKQVLEGAGYEVAAFGGIFK